MWKVIKYVIYTGCANKSNGTLKNYKSRKNKRNEKQFVELESVSHGIFLKTGIKITQKHPADDAGLTFDESFNIIFISF